MLGMLLVYNRKCLQMHSFNSDFPYMENQVCVYIVATPDLVKHDL